MAESAIDVPAVLERLRATAPESTLFAIGRGGRTFLGATPERLVSLNGAPPQRGHGRLHPARR